MLVMSDICKDVGKNNNNEVLQKVLRLTRRSSTVKEKEHLNKLDTHVVGLFKGYPLTSYSVASLLSHQFY